MVLHHDIFSMLQNVLILADDFDVMFFTQKTQKKFVQKRFLPNFRLLTFHAPDWCWIPVIGVSHILLNAIFDFMT